MADFADVIQKFYTQIIVPYYKDKTKPLKINKEYALAFKQTLKTKK